jgi:dTDP-4-dehydrorhamnose reductase
MKVAIVGGSGQIGGWLMHLLKLRGFAVAGNYNSVAYDGLDHVDAADHDSSRLWIKSQKPGLIFYPAGWTWVDGCEKDPEKARKANVLDPLNVARAGKEYGARFVFYSTDYIFDGTNGPNTETDKPNPQSVYARVKLEAEELLQNELGDQFLCLRTAWVQGPERQGKNFTYQVWRNLSQGREMICPNDQISNPTYGPDLAQVSIELAMAGETGIWNVAGPDLWARDDLGREIASAFNLDPGLIIGKTTAELAQPASRPLQGGLNTAKLQNRLANSVRPLHAWLADFREKLSSLDSTESYEPIHAPWAI